MAEMTEQLLEEPTEIAERAPTPPPVKKKTRNDLIDVCRGLLIILVVTGHTSSPFNWLIYAFHMPAWFVISGVLHRERPWKDLIVSKFATLMVPFFAANVILWALLVLLNFKGLNAIFLGERIVYGFEPLIGLVKTLNQTSGMLGATWFLPVLFGVTLVANALIRLARSINLRSPMLLLISLVLSLYASQMGYRPYHLDLALFCQFFYVAGYFVIREKLFPDRTKTIILAVAAAAILYFHHAVYSNFFNISSRRYNNVYYFLIFALAGSYLVFVAAQALVRVRPVRAPLAFIGRNSLYILLLHFIGFKMLMLLACGCGLLPSPELMKFPSSHLLPWPCYVIFAIAFSLGLAAILQWCGGRLRSLLGNQFTVKRLLDDLLFEKAN